MLLAESITQNVMPLLFSELFAFSFRGSLAKLAKIFFGSFTHFREDTGVDPQLKSEVLNSVFSSATVVSSKVNSLSLSKRYLCHRATQLFTDWSKKDSSC